MRVEQRSGRQRNDHAWPDPWTLVELDDAPSQDDDLEHHHGVHARLGGEVGGERRRKEQHRGDEGNLATEHPTHEEEERHDGQHRRDTGQGTYSEIGGSEDGHPAVECCVVERWCTVSFEERRDPSEWRVGDVDRERLVEPQR